MPKPRDIRLGVDVIVCTRQDRVVKVVFLTTCPLIEFPEPMKAVIHKDSPCISGTVLERVMQLFHRHLYGITRVVVCGCPSDEGAVSGLEVYVASDADWKRIICTVLYCLNERNPIHVGGGLVRMEAE